MEWYLRPRLGISKKKLLKHLEVLKSYSFALRNMSLDSKRPIIANGTDSSKKMKVFKSTCLTLLIADKV